MTQTSSASLQFDRLEQDLENWHDQLAQLSQFLAPNEIAKLARRWDLMRQNLDAVFLNYGRPLPNLPMAMDSIPPLMDLTQEELELTLEALVTAKKNLQAFMSESQQRVPLLEEALNVDQKPARLRKCLDKLRAIDEAFQGRLQNLVNYVEQFDSAVTPPETLAMATHKVLEQSKKIDGLRKANLVLEEQKQEMAQWLNDSQNRLQRAPAMPPPSPSALGAVSAGISSRSDVEKSLELLFNNREKIRDARRYLENILHQNEAEKEGTR